MKASRISKTTRKVQICDGICLGVANIVGKRQNKNTFTSGWDAGGVLVVGNIEGLIVHRLEINQNQTPLLPFTQQQRFR